MSPTITLRPYQARAVNNVMRYWRERTATNVCLVSPTGSGKTVMLEEIVHRGRQADARVLWLCHRDSLVRQAKAELERRHLGDVGCVHPDYPREPQKPIQVATVQSMLARGDWPEVKLVITDELHHYVADEWRALMDHYRSVRMVGATATPERSDGRPLGDICEKMVVAANYSELMAAGHIVDCRHLAPPREMAGGVAQDPVRAYNKWAEERSGFVFCGSVERAHELCARFNEAGISARTIVNETDTRERESSLWMLQNGNVRLLVNVYCCTEGVNVPRAKLCMLDRGTGSALTYLQMVGRVLRPFEGQQAMLLDLHGSSLVHGHPTEDRDFSLEGEHAISRKANAEALRQCLRCAYVWRASQGPVCPECGWQAPSKIRPVRIYNEELRELYRGDQTAPEAQLRELVRLKALAGIRGYSTGWVVREWRQLFKTTRVPLDLFTPDEVDEYYNSLVGTAKRKGYSTGWARGLFKSTFGAWPRGNS